MQNRWRMVPVVGAFGLMISAAATAQQDFDEVQIRTVEVAAGVYMLVGRGGNIGLSVGPDGAFIIDDQFAPLTEKIMAAVAGVTDQPVRFVLNTHWHGDHTGGNENLGEAGAMIVAHENVRKRLDPKNFPEVAARSDQRPAGALPVITFTDAVTFHWNDETLHVTHVEKAHTDGDAVVFFEKANVVHMGDTFFNGRYPFIDVNSGGGVNGVIHGADHVLSMTNSSTRIIPGHGDLAGRNELRAYRDMLLTVRDRIQTMLNDGMSEDDVVAAAPTADLDGTWGTNPERFVRGVYQSLAVFQP